MSQLISADALKQKKELLLNERISLINIIKEKQVELDKFLIDNGIDINHLGQYSASLALAAAISLSSLQAMNANLPTDSENAIVFEKPQTIQPEELRGLSNEQKAELVKTRYGGLISRASKKYGVDEDLIFATIMLESGGNAYALRSEPQIGDASYGLGQILYGTAKGIGYKGTPEELFEPEVNIDLIAMYHRRNMDVYGHDLTKEQLTIAYNTGNPYAKPYPGHMSKFNNWIAHVSNLMV